MKKGVFITFEGIEGAGKSTQIEILSEKLKKKGIKTLTTFEPGDTELGKKIRDLLLNPSLSINPLSELLLYFADRLQHIEEKINPFLSQGFVVICDRFTDSTLAYQGYGRGISIELITTLNKILLNSFKPDITILLDLSPEIGLERNKKIKKNDKFELETLPFHNRVRKGFLQIASTDTERFIVIDGNRGINEIATEIYDKLKERLKKLKYEF